MPRKPSRQQLEDELARVRHGYDLCAVAIQILGSHEEATAVEKVRDGERSWAYSLYREDAGHSGIVIEVFHAPGQRDAVQAWILDEMRLPRSEDFTNHLIAIERLKLARSRAWRGEAA